MRGWTPRAVSLCTHRRILPPSHFSHLLSRLPSQSAFAQQSEQMYIPLHFLLLSTRFQASFSNYFGRCVRICCGGRNKNVQPQQAGERKLLCASTHVGVLMQLLQVISLISLFGDLFLNLLKMMVLPLIVCSMITGVISIRSTGLAARARPQPSHFTLLLLLLLLLPPPPPPPYFYANFRSEPRPSLFLDLHLLHRHDGLGNIAGHDHVLPFVAPSPTTSDALYFLLMHSM